MQSQIIRTSAWYRTKQGPAIIPNPEPKGCYLLFGHDRAHFFGQSWPVGLKKSDEAHIFR